MKKRKKSSKTFWDLHQIRQIDKLHYIYFMSRNEKGKYKDADNN